MHEERRARRFDLFKLREQQGDDFPNSRNAQVLLALCACVEKHALREEAILLPLAKRHVSLNEWNDIAGAVDVYDRAVLHPSK